MQVLTRDSCYQSLGLTPELLSGFLSLRLMLSCCNATLPTIQVSPEAEPVGPLPAQSCTLNLQNHQPHKSLFFGWPASSILLHSCAPICWMLDVPQRPKDLISEGSLLGDSEIIKRCSLGRGHQRHAPEGNCGSSASSCLFRD